MATEAIIKIQKMIGHIQHAVQVLGLRNSEKLKKEDLDVFKKEFTPWWWSGKQFDPKNSAQYKILADKILDFFTFEVPDLLLEKFADRTEINFSTGQEIRDFLEGHGANSVARYLGNHFVPKFINDEKLYKKMLWLEWILTQLVGMAKEIDGRAIKMLISSQLNTRLEGTRNFLNTYVKENPKSKNELDNFRITYQKIKIDNQEEAIENQYMRALLVLKPDYLKVTEEKEKNETPVKQTQPTLPPLRTVSSTPSSLGSIDTKHIPKTEPSQPAAKKTTVTIEDVTKQDVKTTQPSQAEISYEFRAVCDSCFPFERGLHILRSHNWISKDYEKMRSDYLEQVPETLILLKEETYKYQQYLKKIIRKKNFTYSSEEDAKFKLKLTCELMESKTVNDFKNLFNASKSHLTKSRDTGTTTFLKAVATIFTAGLAVLFGIWSVRGKKATNKMENILKETESPLKVKA